MKIREGHVSNSSSSSFFLITTKANYEKALEGCSPYVKAVAKALGKHEKISGLEVVSFFAMSSQGEGTLSQLHVDEDRPEGEEDFGVHAAWDEIEVKLSQNKDEILSSSLYNG